jgi:hypothetical protein
MTYNILSHFLALCSYFVSGCTPSTRFAARGSGVSDPSDLLRLHRLGTLTEAPGFSILQLMVILTREGEGPSEYFIVESKEREK